MGGTKITKKCLKLQALKYIHYYHERISRKNRYLVKMCDDCYHMTCDTLGCNEVSHLTSMGCGCGSDPKSTHVPGCPNDYCKFCNLVGLLGEVDEKNVDTLTWHCQQCAVLLIAGLDKKVACQCENCINCCNHNFGCHVAGNPCCRMPQQRVLVDGVHIFTDAFTDECKDCPVDLCIDCHIGKCDSAVQRHLKALHSKDTRSFTVVLQGSRNDRQETCDKPNRLSTMPLPPIAIIKEFL